MLFLLALSAAECKFFPSCASKKPHNIQYNPSYTVGGPVTAGTTLADLVSVVYYCPYSRLTSNFFVSPTYAKTGGCTPLKMSAPRHLLSLWSQNLFSDLFPFNYLRTLSFSASHLSAILPIPSALFAQKPGVPPLLTLILPRLLARHSPLTSVDIQTSAPRVDAACSSDTSICGEQRRGVRRAAAGPGRTGGRGGKDRRGGRERIFRSGGICRRRSL